MTGWPRSLQGRLLAGLLGAVVVLWAAAALLTWRDARHELDELLDGHLAQAAALLVAQQAPGVDAGDQAIDAPQLHRYAPRVMFQVWHEGRLALRSAQAPNQPLVSAAALQGDALAPARRQGRSDDRRDHSDDRRGHSGTSDRSDPGGRSAAAADAADAGDSRHGGHASRHDGAGRHGPAAAAMDFANLRVGYHTVQVAGTDWRVFAAHGAEHDVQVFVGEQLESRAAILWAVLRGALLPLVLALPLLALTIWWAVRQGTAPLRRLGQQLAARAPSALAPVTLDGMPAEMVPMLAALNGLFERIGQMVAAERRFTADAAHELRTPLAAIRTQAQVALAETDGAERAHALRATLAGCDRATRLVDQLLTLSRLEAGAAPALAALDLGALAQRVAAELAPRALQRRQVLGLDAAPGCTVQGNETLVAVLLRNLIDNALRYSPDGAEVRLSVRPQADGVQLRVEDSGPGLAEADRQRLGERFFRVLGSGQSGSGLGWSIVQRIAAVHGAVLDLARAEALGGLAVTVRWPVPPAGMPAGPG